jgi:hypothetical protein
MDKMDNLRYIDDTANLKNIDSACRKDGLVY